MIVINPIRCNNCSAELQPNDLLVGVNDKGNLTRCCKFCNYEEEVLQNHTNGNL